MSPITGTRMRPPNSPGGHLNGITFIVGTNTSFMRFLLSRTNPFLVLLFLYNTAHAQLLNLTKYRDAEQTVTTVRIASASVPTVKWDKQGNWQKIETMVRQAAMQGGAEVVVTPEGALDGYVINEVNAEQDADKKTELVEDFMQLGESIDGPHIRKAANLCRELGIYLVLGFLERREDKLYNSAILIDPEGDIIGRYSKTHFAQGYTINPSCYVPGDQYPVFDTPFGKVGILICYDRQLPEPARILAVKGAQVMFYPSYGSYTDADGWNTVMMRTRAMENGVPLVFSHPFQSLLIDEDGDIRAFGNGGEIVYFQVNTAPERYADRFRNRRPETYIELIEKD
jgi:predicted amidohydrolase